MPHLYDFEPTLPDPHPYIEKALALYDKAVRERRGRVVFISAELGGGKTEHLSALAKALHQAKPAPNFIAGFFSGGEYHRYTLDWQEHVCLKKAVKAVSSIASLLSLYPSPITFAADFLGQLLETGVNAHEIADELKKGPPDRKDGAAWFKKLLRSAAAEKPLVCLLDDWDNAQRFYWDSMLFSLSREIVHELPLLLFVTVKEPLNITAPERDESGLTVVIKSLTGKGLAEWWPLKKLSQDEVAAVIGKAAAGIAAKLHGVTGGNARWVRELWREWRLNETVAMDEADCWIWGGRHKSTVNLYKDIIEDRLTRLLKAETAMEVEEAREVLACAALEGVRFTADAVAVALNWDADELINFLDDVLVQSEDNPDGILLEDGGVDITATDGITRRRWLYRFASDLHWMAMERYGFVDEQRSEGRGSEKLEKSLALVGALNETYAPEEKLVAAPLARLLRNLGSKESAQKYQQMADYAAERDVMREQALLLLHTGKDDWEPWQCERVAVFLVMAGNILFDVFPNDEVRALAEEACTLAHRVHNRDAEAAAHYLSGTALHAETEYKAAREKADIALKIFRLIGRKSGIAHTLILLSMIAHSEGRQPEAKEQATEALHIYRELGRRAQVAGSLEVLAHISFEEKKFTEARDLATPALQMFKELGMEYKMALVMTLLAQIEFRAHRLPEARELAAQALQIKQKFGNRHAIAVSLTLLAEIDFNEGRYAEARVLAIRALRIEEELGNWDVVIGVLLLLGELAAEFHLLDEAFRLNSLSILILSNSGHFYLSRAQDYVAKLSIMMRHTEEQVTEANRLVLEAYQKDGGKELIEDALVRIKEATG